MSDVILARSFIQDIGGESRVNAMLYAAYKRLHKMFPHEAEPHRRWSEGRLRAWWYRQSENVTYSQMTELYQAAKKAKEERALLKAAREEHAEFVRKTARLAQFLEQQDEAFHRPQIDALRGGVGNLDLSRDGGE